MLLRMRSSPSGVRASLKNGVLTVRLPKLERNRKIAIDINEE